MAKPKIEPRPTPDGQYSRRMIVAYRYGSLVFAAIGVLWMIIFSVLGEWGVVAMDIAIFATGISIYVLIRRGKFAFGILASQAALTAIAIVMGLSVDVPTADVPRVSHLYLLVVAALGYLNYQRQKSRPQLVMIGICLTAFIVLASMNLSLPFTVHMPAILRISGTWLNAIIATTMLAACVHAMQIEFIRKDKLSRELLAALWADEFQLVFQPQVNLDEATIGAEALLRWNSHQRGPVSPAEFIPQAEELGLMVAIGDWVLEKGCHTLAEWGRTPHLRHLTLSINVSASQIIDPDFESSVHETLVKTQANPQLLTLELTESVLVTEMELVIGKLNTLRKMGITIALDDFGTGYSSLSYLRRLPIQQIKIDRSFVQDSVNSSLSASLVKNVILIGNDLGHTVLAEGVETVEQQTLLAQAGCTQFQGYLFGGPMPLADFEQRIADETKALNDQQDAQPAPA